MALKTLRQSSHKGSLSWLPFFILFTLLITTAGFSGAAELGFEDQGPHSASLLALIQHRVFHRRLEDVWLFRLWRKAPGPNSYSVLAPLVARWRREGYL